MRSKVNLTRLMQYSARLCETIGAETGQDVGWRNVGSIRLASSDARWEELKRAATAAKSYGFDLELIGPNEVKDKFPLVDLKDVRGATWIASDGYVDPYSLTMAYAKGARAGRREDRRRRHRHGLPAGRWPDHPCADRPGRVACEIVVNAGGLWARHVGEMAGIELPVTVVEHQYLVTEKSPLIPERAANVARSGPEFLSQVRAGRARDRRLGTWHHCGERPRQVAARFRPGAVRGKTSTGCR